MIETGKKIINKKTKSDKPFKTEKLERLFIELECLAAIIGAAIKFIEIQYI